MADRNKPTLTAQEAADLLGVNRQTLTLAAKAGQAPCLRLGDRLVFPAEAYQNFLETGSFDGKPAVDVPMMVRQMKIEELRLDIEMKSRQLRALEEQEAQGNEYLDKLRAARLRKIA